MTNNGLACSPSRTTHDEPGPSAGKLKGSGAGTVGEGGVAGLGVIVGLALCSAAAGVAASRAWLGGPNSSWIDESTPTVITPPQTEQRARTPSGGTFDGSTRKTDLHSGQETFTSPPVPLRLATPWTASLQAPRSRVHPLDGRRSTPSPATSSRSSSSPWPERSLEPRE